MMFDFQFLIQKYCSLVMVLRNAELFYVRNIYLVLELKKIEVIIPNRGLKKCATHRRFHRIIKSVLHMLYNAKIITLNIIFTVKSWISSLLIRTAMVFSVRKYKYHFCCRTFDTPCILSQ